MTSKLSDFNSGLLKIGFDVYIFQLNFCRYTSFSRFQSEIFSYHFVYLSITRPIL